MNRLNLLISSCLYFLVLASCTAILTHNSSFSAESGGILQTDAKLYEAEFFQDDSRGVQFQIPYTITNTTNEAVYMIGCKQPSGPVLHKRKGDKWIPAYSQIEQACLSPPFIFEPGEQRQDTLYVHGHFPGQNIHPVFHTDVEGVFRLEIKVYSDPDTFDSSGEWDENELSKDLRISNTFQVKWK